MLNKIFLFFIASLFLVYIIKLYYCSRQEALTDLNFVVDGITEHPSSAISLYSNTKKYIFYNFHLTKFDNIKIGDRISKPKCSNIVKVYRKDSNKVEFLYLQIRCNVLFFNYKCGGN